LAAKSYYLLNTRRSDEERQKSWPRRPYLNSIGSVDRYPLCIEKKTLKPMRLLIFGAAGRIGTHTLRRALDEGHHVFAVARTPSKISMPAGERCVHVKGDALSAESVEAAFAAAAPIDAVISTVGVSRDSPATAAMTIAQNYVASCRKHGVKRLILLAGVQVYEEGDQLPFSFRVWGCLFRALGMGPALRNSAAMLAWLKSDCKDIDWTVARPTVFKDGPSPLTDVSQLYAGPVSGVSSSIYCVDLARFLTGYLAPDGPFKQSAPGVSNRA
jgi:putative NADH-flavin reductase